MTTSVTVTQYVIRDRRTGELRALDGGDYDVIRPGDAVAMADGGDIPVALLDALPHRRRDLHSIAGARVHRIPRPDDTPGVSDEPWGHPGAPEGHRQDLEAMTKDGLIEAIRALDPDTRVNRSWGDARLREILAELMGAS